MSEIVLSVDVRERTGTGGARAARREARVPGVIYGGPLGSVAISLDLKELKKAIAIGRLRSRVIEIDHKGQKQPVIVREIQFHPVTDAPMHVDLMRVAEDQIISVDVPVRFVGHETSPGLKRGGALNIVRHNVGLDCPAGRIPAEILIDLKGLEIGDSVHISAVTLPEGIRPTIKDRDFTIATIAGAGGQDAEAKAESEEGPAGGAAGPAA